MRLVVEESKTGRSLRSPLRCDPATPHGETWRDVSLFLLYNSATTARQVRLTSGDYVRTRDLPAGEVRLAGPDGTPPGKM